VTPNANVYSTVRWIADGHWPLITRQYTGWSN